MGINYSSDLKDCLEVSPNGTFLRVADSSFFTQMFALHSASAQANGQIEYIGFSKPGNGISASAWAIKRLGYDASGNVNSILWAKSSISLNCMWDDRATYVYG